MTSAPDLLRRAALAHDECRMNYNAVGDTISAKDHEIWMKQCRTLADRLERPTDSMLTAFAVSFKSGRKDAITIFHPESNDWREHICAAIAAAGREEGEGM